MRTKKSSILNEEYTQSEKQTANNKRNDKFPTKYFMSDEMYVETERNDAHTNMIGVRVYSMRKEQNTTTLFTR